MSRLKKGLLRLADRPSATALACVLLAGGLIALFDLGLTADVLTPLVPDWLLNVLSVMYALAGALLLVGMAADRADIEAAGCILTVSGVLVRLLAVVDVLGVTPATTSLILLYVAIGWAFAERFRQILGHQRIVRVNGHLDVKEDPDDDWPRRPSV